VQLGPSAVLRNRKQPKMHPPCTPPHPKGASKEQRLCFACTFGVGRNFSCRGFVKPSAAGLMRRRTRYLHAVALRRACGLATPTGRVEVRQRPLHGRTAWERLQPAARAAARRRAACGLHHVGGRDRIARAHATDPRGGARRANHAHRARVCSACARSGAQLRRAAGRAEGRRLADFAEQERVARRSRRLRGLGRGA
jgi:hypothetical protein